MGVGPCADPDGESIGAQLAPEDAKEPQQPQRAGQDRGRAQLCEGASYQRTHGGTEEEDRVGLRATIMQLSRTLPRDNLRRATRLPRGPRRDLHTSARPGNPVFVLPIARSSFVRFASVEMKQKNRRRARGPSDYNIPNIQLHACFVASNKVPIIYSQSLSSSSSSVSLMPGSGLAVSRLAPKSSSLPSPLLLTWEETTS